jgi:hypothetical protein
LFHIQGATAVVLSIRSEAPFKAMRECARDCLAWNGSIDLIGEFGCGFPQQNECFCRADLGPAASKHISTCASTYCTAGGPDGDIATAINIYNSYCLANGFGVTAVPTTAAKTTAAATQTRQGTLLDDYPPKNMDTPDGDGIHSTGFG